MVCGWWIVRTVKSDAKIKNTFHDIAESQRVLKKTTRGVILT